MAHPDHTANLKPAERVRKRDEFLKLIAGGMTRAKAAQQVGVPAGTGNSWVSAARKMNECRPAEAHPVEARQGPLVQEPPQQKAAAQEQPGCERPIPPGLSADEIRALRDHREKVRNGWIIDCETSKTVKLLKSPELRSPWQSTLRGFVRRRRKAVRGNEHSRDDAGYGGVRQVDAHLLYKSEGGLPARLLTGGSK